MIANRFKQLIERSGKTQSAVAKECGITPSRFSDVVQGRCILETEDLNAVCKSLNAEPSAVYSEKILDAIYGVEEQKPKESTTVSVRISKATAEWLDRLVETEMYRSRNEAVNAIINAKRRATNGWNDFLD